MRVRALTFTLALVSALSGPAQAEHEHAHMQEQNERTAEQSSQENVLVKVTGDATSRYKDVALARWPATSFSSVA